MLKKMQSASGGKRFPAGYLINRADRCAGAAFCTFIQNVSLRLPEEKIFDKRVDIAIKHTVDVANFMAGPMIFHHPVWL